MQFPRWCNCNHARPLSSGLVRTLAAIGLRASCQFASRTLPFASLPVVACEMLSGLFYSASVAWFLFHTLSLVCCLALSLGCYLASFAPASIAAPVFVRRVLVSWFRDSTLAALFGVSGLPCCGRFANGADAAGVAPSVVRRVLVSWSLFLTLPACFLLLAALHARAAPALPTRLSRHAQLTECEL